MPRRPRSLAEAVGSFDPRGGGGDARQQLLGAAPRAEDEEEEEEEEEEVKGGTAPREERINTGASEGCNPADDAVAAAEETWLRAQHAAAGYSPPPSRDEIDKAAAKLRRATFVAPQNKSIYAAGIKLAWLSCDLRTVVNLLRRLLCVDSGDPETKRQLAEALHQQGQLWLKLDDFVEARSCFDEAANMQPGSASHHLVGKSVACIKLNMLDEALRSLNKVISIRNCRSADMYCLRYKVLVALGSSKQADEDMLAAEELEPGHEEVKLWRQGKLTTSEKLYEDAKSAVREGRHSDALIIIFKALALAPEDMRLIILRSVCHRSMGQFDAALGDLDEVSFSLFCPRYCNLMGHGQPKGGGEADLRREFKRKLEDYETAAADSLLSWEPVYVTQQRIATLNEMALREMSSLAGSRGASPNATPYHGPLATLNKALSYIQAVKSRCDEGSLSSLTKQEGRLLVNRGDCYRELGGEEALSSALADYTLANEREDSWETSTRISVVHYRRGIVEFNRGKFSEAIPEFSAAIERNWKISAYYFARGRCYYYLGNRERASKDFARASDINQGDEEARFLALQANQGSDSELRKSFLPPAQGQSQGRGGTTACSTTSTKILTVKNASQKRGSSSSKSRSSYSSSQRAVLSTLQPLRRGGPGSRRNPVERGAVATAYDIFTASRSGSSLSKDAAWSMMRFQGKRWGRQGRTT